MAALDIVAVATANRNNTSLSQSVTPVSGESLIVFVGIQGNLDTTISSVVFNTTESLTHIGTTSATANQHAIAIYYLAAPTATTANVVATFSNAGPFRSNHLAVLRVEALNAYRTPEGATGLASTVLDAVTSASGEKVVSASLFFRGTFAPQTAAGDLTALVNTDENSEFCLVLGTAAGAASVSANFGLGQSSDGDEPWVVHSVALQAASAAVIGRGLLTSQRLAPRSLVAMSGLAQVRRPALVGFERKLAA